MDDTAAGIHIDDLARPTFSPEVTEMRAGMAAIVDDCPLDAAVLHQRAVAETGLTDFGPRDYEARLDVLLGALREVDGLTACGIVGFHAQILQMLKNRLLLHDRLTRFPEIHDIVLQPPIIIAGLPRTGTTHLHNLLGAAPMFRTLPYWESLEPFALASEIGVEPDPRRTRTEAAVWFVNEAMPLFPLMHEMTTDHLHEEIQLLAIDFSTMFFESIALVPAWEHYYRAHDQRPHYWFLRTVLQALQRERGNGRWLLKSPQHLEQLPVLADVFPDATVVITHRDPAEVVVSMATMVAYTARMHAEPVDPSRLGQAWAARIEALLTACLRDRDVIPAEHSIDVRFDAFMADTGGTVSAIFDLAREPLTEPASAAMRAYLGSHARGRLGRIDYRAADVGLDLDDLHARFTDYSNRFLAD